MMLYQNNRTIAGIYRSLCVLLLIATGLLAGCGETEEEAMAIWHDRIDNPQVGDFYGVNYYTIKDEKATDDVQFVVFRVVDAENSEEITFIESSHIYTSAHIDRMLYNGDIKTIEMHPHKFTYPKKKLKAMLDVHTVGGVFRLD